MTAPADVSHGTANTNLADLLETAVGRHSDKVAVVADDRAVTYAEFVDRTHRFANVLRGIGVAPGDHVGVALRNTLDHLTALFAAFTLRAAPVNINLRYTAGEMRALFVNAGLTALVHEPDLEPVVRTASGDALPAPRRLAAGPTLHARLATAPSQRPDAARSGDDPYLLFTGGTTGTPKGVQWRHEDLYFGALQGGAPTDASRLRLLPTSPLTHGTAQWVTLITLLSGGTVVLTPSGAFDAEAVWTIAERERVTHLTIVGDAFARPLVAALDAHPERWDLADLLAVVSGGATLSGPVREALLDHLPGAAVVDGYGTSEIGRGGQMAVFPGQSAPGLLRFVPGPDTAVLDDEFSPIKPGSGAVGRLARRGHLPSGYYGDPDRTGRTFVEVDGERWGLPGDLATVDAEGRVVLLGRSERIINTGGEKIFAEEVEAVLASHPAVVDAVVVGVPDERWGERVTAVVALAPARTASPADLIEHCRSQLAGFKTPRHIELVDRVQRLVNGKPDHRWARLVAGRTTRREPAAGG